MEKIDHRTEANLPSPEIQSAFVGELQTLIQPELNLVINQPDLFDLKGSRLISDNHEWQKSWQKCLNDWDGWIRFGFGTPYGEIEGMCAAGWEDLKGGSWNLFYIKHHDQTMPYRIQYDSENGEIYWYPLGSGSGLEPKTAFDRLVDWRGKVGIFPGHADYTPGRCMTQKELNGWDMTVGDLIKSKKSNQVWFVWYPAGPAFVNYEYGELSKNPANPYGSMVKVTLNGFEPVYYFPLLVRDGKRVGERPVLAKLSGYSGNIRFVHPNYDQYIFRHTRQLSSRPNIQW